MCTAGVNVSSFNGDLDWGTGRGALPPSPFRHYCCVWFRGVAPFQSRVSGQQSQRVCCLFSVVPRAAKSSRGVMITAVAGSSTAVGDFDFPACFVSTGGIGPGNSNGAGGPRDRAAHGRAGGGGGGDPSLPPQTEAAPEQQQVILLQQPDPAVFWCTKPSKQQQRRQQQRRRQPAQAAGAGAHQEQRDCGQCFGERVKSISGLPRLGGPRVLVCLLFLIFFACRDARTFCFCAP